MGKKINSSNKEKVDSDKISSKYNSEIDSNYINDYFQEKTIWKNRTRNRHRQIGREY